MSHWIRTGGVVLWIAMVSIGWGQSPSDMVGTWSMLGEDALVFILTIGQDFTYRLETQYSSTRLLIERGTYEVSENTMIFTPEDAEKEPYAFTILAVSEEELVFSGWEGEMLSLVRGIIEPPPLGEGSISGTIRYGGSLEESQALLVMAFAFGDAEDIEALGITSIPTPGPYTIPGLRDGSYLVCVLLIGRDEVFDLSMDSLNPAGVYGTPDGPEWVEITQGAAITGIDIQLVEIPTAVVPYSWGQVKAAFRRGF